MEKKIALIPGDGIGPDVVAEAVKVLDKVAEKFGHKWSYDTVTAGGCSIDKFGKPLIQEELDKCLKSDAPWCSWWSKVGQSCFRTPPGKGSSWSSRWNEGICKPSPSSYVQAA